MIQKLRIADPKSQKARGVQVVSRIGSDFGFLSNDNVCKARLISFAADDSWIVGNVDYPTFARPCPTRPRHGFVDSRIVNSDADLLTMIQEIRDSGEDWIEILLCPPVDAEWSAIWTPTTLTLGPGNDGATSGHNSVVIPLISSEGMFFDTIRYRTDSRIENTTYCEIVSDGNGAPEVVQLRDGPAIPAERNYIPEDTTVQCVVWADGDLLEWETRAREFEPGTVVYHPGGSLASHYAVHCVLNNVPIICSGKQPEIGEKLKAVKRAVRLTREHHNEIARALAEFFHRSIYTVDLARHYLEVAFAVLHNLTLLDLREPAHRNLYAFGIATMIKCATALLAGEMRHYVSSGPGRYSGEPCPIKGISRGDHGRRTQIYGKYLRHAIEYSAVKLPQLRYGFVRPGWSSSFGGARWADCAKTTELLIREVALYLTDRKDRDQRLNRIASVYNNLVHCVHNGGRFFNKLLSTSIMDQIATWPVRGLLNNATWKVITVEPSTSRYPKSVGARLLKVLDQGERIAGTLFKDTAECRGGAVVINPSEFDWTKAQAKPIPGGGLHFQIPKVGSSGKYLPGNWVGPESADIVLADYGETTSLSDGSETVYHYLPLTVKEYETRRGTLRTGVFCAGVRVTFNGIGIGGQNDS